MQPTDRDNFPKCSTKPSSQQLAAPDAYVEVQRPGNFRNPDTQCAPLFKHGLSFGRENIV